MNSGVYCIINNNNNKKYIGCTCNLKKRKEDHFYRLKKNIHENDYLQKSFNKYGIENFEFFVLDNCNVNIMSSIENFWINQLNTLDREYGYNIRYSSPYLFRCSHSEETKKKMSIHIKNNPRGACVKGSKRSKETIEKISKSKKGLPISESTIRAKIKALSKQILDLNSGIYYDSITEMCNCIGVSVGYVNYRIKKRKDFSRFVLIN